MVKYTIQIEIDDNYERDLIVNSCLKEMFDDVFKTFSTKKYEAKSQTYMEIEEQHNNNQIVMIKDIFDRNQIDIIRQIPFTHYLSQQKYNLYHAKVHQQFVANVCGYHASFNILEVMEALKEQRLNRELRILSSGEFWKYKNEITQFIWQHKLKYEPKNDKFPWRQQDVHQGDFERTYLNICLKKHPRFNQALCDQKNFQVMYYSWEYQFGRIVLGDYQQKELQQMMDQFIKFNKKNQHLVFVMMLGITNHWGSFIAHKCNENIEFWFFDSRNRDYLLWDDEQIEQWCIEAQEKRKKLGQKPWSEFDKQVQTTCVHDIQESLETLCQCLLGNMTLHDYQSNNLFQVFEKAFRKHISMEDVLNQKNLEKQVANCNHYSKDFYHTIYSFLKTPHILKFLTPTNQEKFMSMKKAFSMIQQQNKIMNPKTYQHSYIESLNNLLLRANL
ncbi:hypothetical protein ABPG74_022818 [Tetrahymena malaccensis]